MLSRCFALSFTKVVGRQQECFWFLLSPPFLHKPISSRASSLHAPATAPAFDPATEDASTLSSIVPLSVGTQAPSAISSGFSRFARKTALFRASHTKSEHDRYKLELRFLQRRTSADSRTYDVFLNFRGADTRTGFTDCLYNSLVDAGLRVFRDNNTLRVGKQIGPELVEAIRSCRIAIPIISKNYARSKWCLRELTEIMDCYKKSGKSVLPVFYGVDVLDVHGRGDFKGALEEHVAKCRKEVPEWKEALRSVAYIRGWISQNIANGHDGELAKIVVAKVSSELKTIWIERLPIFPILMSNYHIRSVYGYFSDTERGEVFLAFRGPDTRQGFAACLYNSLVNRGIRVFRDDDPSLIGKHLALGINNAISHCKISIPILSENYVSSTWCLNDLAEMVDAKKKGQKILPIFYKVNPSHVKDISNSFQKKMHQHTERVDKSNYERWIQALREVGSLKGLESDKFANGDEGMLVKQVVEEVWQLLTNPKRLEIP